MREWRAIDIATRNRGFSIHDAPIHRRRLDIKIDAVEGETRRTYDLEKLWGEALPAATLSA